MSMTDANRSQDPVFEHGDWVQVYVDPDESGEGPGLIRIEERHGAPGVAVLPIRGTSIGLVRIFRRNLGRTVLEIPRGFGGESSGPRGDAVRELHEETGIEVAEEALVDLGSVAPNSGILTSEVSLFAIFVDDSTPVGNVVDIAEVDSFDWYELSEVVMLAVQGVLTDAFTHAALGAAAMRGIIHLQPAAGDRAE